MTRNTWKTRWNCSSAQKKADHTDTFNWFHPRKVTVVVPIIQFLSDEFAGVDNSISTHTQKQGEREREKQRKMPFFSPWTCIRSAKKSYFLQHLLSFPKQMERNHYFTKFASPFQGAVDDLGCIVVKAQENQWEQRYLLIQAALYLRIVPRRRSNGISNAV